MEKKYCLDTNSYIRLFRDYPRNNTYFKKIWEDFDTLVEKDLIVSPMETFFELNRRDDEISKWAKKHKKQIFIDLDDDQIKIAKDILSKYPKLHDLAKRKFDSDPFVISLAKSKKLTVVSDEKKTQLGGRTNIPNVCLEYKIKCLTLVEFFQEIAA